MSYWLREIAGWTLLVISLLMIGLLYLFCERRMILEIWPWTIMSIFVFRGSIHLLKVAIAARIANQVQDRLYPSIPSIRNGKPTTAYRLGDNQGKEKRPY